MVTDCSGINQPHIDHNPEWFLINQINELLHVVPIAAIYI